jgi:3-oxoacyl-[acyl-carrier-protein] synthase II
MSAEALWEGVKNGRVAIRPVQQMPMDGYLTTIGGEVQGDAKPEHEYNHPDGYRERTIDFALKATEEAMAAARLTTDDVPAERWGVILGTCNAGLTAGETWYHEKMQGKNPDPHMLCLVSPQSLSEAVSGAYGLKGPVLSIDTACAASANAIGYAAEIIRSGQADAVITGGAESLSDVLFAGFSSLESLSPVPAAPYSGNRHGLSLGEGSGILVLVREDVAKKAGTPVLAEVVGYGLSADGYHPTAPHPEGKGAARAIKAALTSAGVDPSEVKYVNSHGTGTPKNDPAETNATKVGLGEETARKAAVSSTKSMIGHLLGAAGAVENIVTIKALDDQIAPPTANYAEPDPECDLDYVPNHARPLKMDVAISNNFAFGGANACVVLARGGSSVAPPPLPDFDRVVITGFATLSDAGADPEELWQAYSTGRQVTQMEDGVRVGRADIDFSRWLTPRERRRVDRLGVFSVIASKVALEDAGIEVTDENRERIGVIFGTGAGPIESFENFVRPLLEEGPKAANPGIFPNTVYNAAGGQVAMQVGAIGPASTVTAGHAAGASSLVYGYDLVASNRADAVVCLGVDTLSDTLIRGYRELGVLDMGEGNGFALAESGVALVVERLSKAQDRGARIHGEVLGYGIASDGKGVGRFDPRGFGIERAMNAALERAQREPSAITAIWGNSAGYRLVDGAEEAAVKRVFGDETKLRTPKKQLGEPVGAGASLNVALALKSWEQEGASGKGPVLVNSSTLGGTHFSIVLAPYVG